MNDLKYLKHELQNLINGKSHQGQDNLIQSAKAWIGNSSQAGTKGESAESIRSEEERALIEFAGKWNLFLTKEQLGEYVTEGAEQKVYYDEQSGSLFKVADAIFYTCWKDYFNNLLLHNYFFPDTAYTLKGFIKEGEKFYTVVQQPFVIQTDYTNLESVKNYLIENGFVNKKNNDYYHPYLGIILEDLHDENVLTAKGLLFFIDTVFYITDAFYQQP